MADQTFGEFLKAGGHDEESMSPERRAQLQTFWKEKKASPPPVVTDADGEKLARGDTVKITLVVTGVHRIPGDPNRGVPDRCYVNLARIVDGVELHQFNYDAALVKKNTLIEAHDFAAPPDKEPA